MHFDRHVRQILVLEELFSVGESRPRLGRRDTERGHDVIRGANTWSPLFHSEVGNDGTDHDVLLLAVVVLYL